MLELSKTTNKVTGVKQTLRALECGEAKQVYLALDADEKILIRVKDFCSKQSVEIVYTESMKQLGKVCGIDVDAAVACILK